MREREREREKEKKTKETRKASVRRDVIETQITLRNPLRRGRSGPDRNVLALIKYEV